MALVGIELVTHVSEPDALTTRPIKIFIIFVKAKILQFIHIATRCSFHSCGYSIIILFLLLLVVGISAFQFQFLCLDLSIKNSNC